MIPPLVLIPVEPLAVERSLMFVTRTHHVEGEGGGVEEMSRATYPKSARGAELQALRNNPNQWITLRRASEILKLTAVQICGLERGQYTLSEQDWARALAALRASLNEETTPR